MTHFSSGMTALLTGNDGTNETPLSPPSFRVGPRNPRHRDVKPAHRTRLEDGFRIEPGMTAWEDGFRIKPGMTALFVRNDGTSRPE